jgi:Calx-beta domain-containing protein
VLLALLKAAPRRPRRSGSASLIVLVLVLAGAGWWVIGHMDVVSQIAADAGGDLKDALAGANAAVTRFWQQPRSAVSSSPAAQPPAPPQAVEEGTPAAVQSPEPSPTIPRAARPRATGSSSVSTSAPASRPVAPRMAAPAVAAAQPSHARIELSADSVEVPLTDPAAHVLVKRTGNLHADAGFTWWTESGTAKSGQDFMSVKPHEEHFEQGKSVINLFVPVVSDPTRKQSKSFYIVINDPSDGASLGKRTLTMVTIPPSE